MPFPQAVLIGLGFGYAVKKLYDWLAEDTVQPYPAAPTEYGRTARPVPPSSSSSTSDRRPTEYGGTTRPVPPSSSSSTSDRRPTEYGGTTRPVPSSSSSSTSERLPKESGGTAWRVPSSSPSSSSTTGTDSTRPYDFTFPPLSSSVSSTRSSTETKVFCVEKNTTSTYEIPQDFVGLIKKDIVPRVLKTPLSPSSYKDYFASLLYAEDYYIEKWSDFSLSNVTLELQKAAIYEKPSKSKNSINKGDTDDKLFVSFEMNSIPERRPFLLSRDFVFVRPSGTTVEPFQGILYRVVKSTLVLVEFKEDFHSQHQPNRKYDVSFSFNRVCLKRCHKAIETAAANTSLLNFLFPNPITTSSSSIPSSLIASHHVCRLEGSPPYVVEGPPSVTSEKLSRTGTLVEGPPSVTSEKLSRTGTLIQKMVLQILKSSPCSRVLVCAPLNNTCDVFMRSLKREIPESSIFRANAAFRELDDVPDDIISSCTYKGECFTCPSLGKLMKFKVIISTFVTSFRLNTEGITAGHFSHIFMLDASSATEPETMVTLANFVGEKTAVVVTGTERNFSRWVRSDIGRKHGLQKSYFQRLLEMEPYSSHSKFDHAYWGKWHAIGSDVEERR